jgi:hypothetical protein
MRDLHAHFALFAANSGLEESSEAYAKRWQQTCGYTFSESWKGST